MLFVWEAIFFGLKKEILEKTKEWTAREKKNSFSFAFEESISKQEKGRICWKCCLFCYWQQRVFFKEKKTEGKKRKENVLLLLVSQYYWDLSLLPSKENYLNLFVQIVIFGNFQNFAEHFLPRIEISKMAWFFPKNTSKK